jgi:hypothetical protein
MLFFKVEPSLQSWNKPNLFMVIYVYYQIMLVILFMTFESLFIGGMGLMVFLSQTVF